MPTYPSWCRHTTCRPTIIPDPSCGRPTRKTADLVALAAIAGRLLCDLSSGGKNLLQVVLNALADYVTIDRGTAGRNHLKNDAGQRLRRGLPAGQKRLPPPWCSATAAARQTQQALAARGTGSPATWTNT